MNFNKIISRVTMLAILALMIPQSAFAGTMVNAQLKLTTNEDSVVSNQIYTFETESGIGVGETITLTMSDFSINASLSSTDVTISEGDNTCDASPGYVQAADGAGAASGATWQVLRTSGTTLTLTNDTDVIAANICIKITVGTIGGGTYQVTNPVATGSKSVMIATSADTSSVAVGIVDDPTVAIDGYIGPSLTLAIDDIAISLGALSSSSTTTNSDATVTVTTNAGSGYTLVYNATAFTNQNAYAITPQATQGTYASGVGTEKWGINANGGSHTSGTVEADYATAANYMAVVGTDTTLATSAADATSDAYNIEVAVNIEATTPAGSYSNTIDFIVYAMF